MFDNDILNIRSANSIAEIFGKRILSIALEAARVNETR